MPALRTDSGAITVKADLRIAREVLLIRLCQLIINEKYKKKEFRVPIHLAMGHESIAVAVSDVMKDVDQLILPHRNLHYNLARGASLRAVIDEFLLKDEGLASGGLGSMNLVNRSAGIHYTSSILGNNLGVATGVALANKVNQNPGLVIVVLGDGAIEEGAFHEALLFMASQNLSALLIVENNSWSLATHIENRRCPIDLGLVSRGLGGRYAELKGNDPYQYVESLTDLRDEALGEKVPLVVEVAVSSLGSWRMTTDEHPEGKYVNYHAGPAPNVELSEWPLLSESEDDPIFVLGRYFEENQLRVMAKEILRSLEDQLG